MRAATLKQKISEDFAGARVNWPGEQMAQWVFVHNDHEGLPASVMKQLESLRNQHPDVLIETWGYPELLRIKEKLGLSALESVFGTVPTGSDYESMDICDLKQVIDSLEQEDSPQH